MLVNKKNNESKQNNKQMLPAETLFEYLKRKKEMALKQMLNDSLNKYQNIKQQQSEKYDKTNRKNKKNSCKKRNINQSIQSQKQNDRRYPNKSILQTKRQKNQGKFISRTFVVHTPNLQKQDEDYFKLQPQIQKIQKITNTRSFISMISPLKNKERSLSTSKTNYAKISVQQSLKRQNRIRQNYIQKSIKEKISIVQENFEKQTKFQKQIKQKFKQFSSVMTSIINQIQQNQQIFKKCVFLQNKTKNAKAHIKLINSFLVNKSSDHHDQNQNLLSQLYQFMKQNIDSLSGQFKNQSNLGKINQMNALRHEYEIKIDEILKQKNRLSQQINISSKKNQKIQNQYNKLLQKYNDIQCRIKQINEKNIQSKEELTISISRQIQFFVEQNRKLMQDKVKLQKRLKDSDYRLDQFIRKNKKQSEDKFNQRECFLIKQIQVLKNQYSKDIACINNFHKNRQEKLLKQIKILQVKYTESLLKIKQLEQTIKQKQRQILSNQSLVKQISQKKQDTLQDLYRLNEQLYRHWNALKDIKTLLYRLNLYEKFHTIYKDLIFNEYLFLN